MFKIITALTLLTLPTLAGTWLIEGTPTGIPSGSGEETLRLNQTVQQTITNGAVRVEGKYVYEEAYPPNVNFWYFSTTAKEPNGASGTVALNPDGTGFTYGSYEVLVYNFLDNGGTKYICTMNAVSVYSVIDGSTEDSYSITITPDGTYLDKGYYDHSTANYSGEGTSAGIIVVVTDLGSGTKYSQILPANTQAIELTDPTFTGWTVISSISDLGTQEILYPSFPGNSYASQDVFIYSKRIVEGQEFYSYDTHIYYLSTPSVIYNDHTYDNTIYFFSSFSFYQDPSVYSYIVVDWVGSKWTEILTDGTSNEIWVNVGDQNWYDYWPYTWQIPPTTTPTTPSILKPDIFLASNEAASVVINGDGQIVSIVSDPNTYPPLIVNSGVKVDNLNADSLDGYGGDAFVQSVSGTAPISVSAGKTPTVSHLDTNGYKHVPTNGTMNQILKNAGTGIASWGLVTENAGYLSNVTTLAIVPTNTPYIIRMTRDTNGVFSLNERHFSVDKGYYIIPNSGIDRGSEPNDDVPFTFNAWVKGPPTGTSYLFCNSGNANYFTLTETGNDTRFYWYYHGYAGLDVTIPKTQFSSGWNMITLVRFAYMPADLNRVYLYLNGVQVSGLQHSLPNYYFLLRYFLSNSVGSYSPNYPIDEIGYFRGYNLSSNDVYNMYQAGIGRTVFTTSTEGSAIRPSYPNYTPTFLFRFSENRYTGAVNENGTTEYAYTHPQNVQYFDGEVCFKKTQRTQNLISSTGIPTGTVSSVTTTFGDYGFDTLIQGKDFKITPPRWGDVIVSGIALRNGGTSPTRELVTPDSGIYGTGFALNEDSDYVAQVQHGVASTNVYFKNFYYNPHIHCTVSAVTAPNTNATFVLTWEIAPVSSNFLGTSISRTGTVSFTVAETNVHKLVSFGFVTNNVLQGADSLIFRGNIKRIATPTLGNDAGAKVIVDSLDYHFPFDSIGSTAIFGDAP
jgi:hypothetical protein